MYKVKAPKIYVHEEVTKDPACMKRMERMLSSIECETDPVTVGDEELNEISGRRGWSSMGDKRTGERKLGPETIVIFNKFRWMGEDERAAQRKRFPHIAGHYLDGSGAWTFHNGRATLATQRGVCQNAYLLHSAWGCLHRCDYCNIGEFLNIMLNIEELVERLDGLVHGNKWQRLYKYDNNTDIPTFEPEYGACALMVDYFARQEDAFLMLYTKSDNVGHLLKLDHRGHTIICWSLSCDTVSRKVERYSAPMEDRIAAARACQEAGYIVRARFSPIIPVKNWQEENARMLERYLSSVRPDVLTMDMLKWVEPGRVRDLFDVSLWDEEYLACADELAAMEPEQRPIPVIPNGKQLFPDELRLRVYRFFIERIKKLSPSTRIALCGETPEMWEMLEPELGMTPADYVCACGPTSVPGNPLFTEPRTAEE